MLYLFGIGINLFLILLLFSKKNKIVADKFLLVWLIIICLHLLLFIIATTTDYESCPDLAIIGVLLPLLHGPMLYLYTGATTNLLPINKKIWTLHFLPFIVLFLLFSPFYLLSTEDKLLVITSGGKGFKFQLIINEYAIIISGIVYVFWLFIILNKHKINIAKQFSYDEKIKLNWLRYLIYGLGVIWLIIIAQSIIVKSYDDYIFGAAVILVVIIGYFGIRQGRIYDSQIISISENYLENNLLNEQFKIDQAPTGTYLSEDISILSHEKQAAILIKKKYANSGLTEKLSQNLHSRLKELMKNEKLYIESELTLAALAEKLGIHPNYLSQVINEKEGKSFYDYINTLRVEEFKRLLLIQENSKYTLMSLAFDCGFNSKSSFNKNFKKVTGLSPSEYLNKSI
jgi:AraC-like DNA-binding protein